MSAVTPLLLLCVVVIGTIVLRCPALFSVRFREVTPGLVLTLAETEAKAIL